ncbi:Foldase protein PrsA 3 [Methylobacterium brachiatum]|jgi:peptidyl-prolyl cis-trans isomerase C|nr:Foldase protein PrsA 3 [Methylobacterium brachiatum]
MISVDGVVIADDLLSLEAQLQDAEDPAAAWESAARSLVIRQLLLAEAAKRGISDRDPEPGEEPDEVAIRRLLEAELNLPEPTEDELERWYERNLERLRLPDLWQVQHLLVAADPKDERAAQTSRQRAEAFLAEVLEDPDRLTTLAAQFSDCPSKAQGGDLGLIERGSTVPEFEAHLVGLTAGEVCPHVVKSRYGMHIIRVLACEPGRAPPLAAVRSRIAAFLQEASWRQAVQGYIAALAARARIKGFDLFEGENAPPRPSAWPAGSSCTAAPSADLPPGPTPGRKVAGARVGGCC